MNINWDLIFLVLFILGLYLFYHANKSKFEVQSKFFFIYKSKMGLKLMDRISKWPKWILHSFSVLSIITGFAGMVMMAYTIVVYTFKFMLSPSTNSPVLSPVLPGINIPGVGVISFFHWIIAIFIVATIHEFSHGFIARFFKIKVKSSGFLFFGPLLGAFVEPDEKQLSKKPKYAQLSVFSAGPFSNILTGAIFLLILSAITLPILGMFEYHGVQVVSADPQYPAAIAGIKAGETILAINNKEVPLIKDFSDILNETKPYQKIKIMTDKNNYTIALTANPQNKDKGFLGVVVQPASSYVKKDIESSYGKFLPNAALWIYYMFKWLFLVSLGIALFNLLPMGPLDGGRMFLTSLMIVFKDEKKAKLVWGIISWFLFALIIVNLLPLLKDFIMFLIKPFLSI